MQRIFEWLGREQQARRRVKAIAEAYVAWLAVDHPHVYDAHAQALAALAEVRCEAELTTRIARLDRLVARAA